MPRLVLGPILRYLSDTEATIWLETDAPCEVEILGTTDRTFCVERHHYALVCLTGLDPGVGVPYEVRLNGERHWPEPDSPFPPSLIRGIAPDERLKIVFGSCRVAVPHETPYDLSPDDDERGREVDALYALAHRMKTLPPEEWPDLLLMIGDQVYADEDAPRTREFIKSRRDTSEAPYEGVLDFEEYTRLYWETWGDPAIRWLLSTVSTAMIFDDHDVHDDWNTSEAWCREIEQLPWWHERITSALMTYWLYQDLGNRSPEELGDDSVLARVRRGDDAGEYLRTWATDADAKRNGRRFSYSRVLGRTKLVVFDSREGRTLTEGRRRMFDDEEWDWICQQVEDACDHLILADTLPVLMTPAFHYLEAWNEAVCAGAWGSLGQRLCGENVRRAVDLEHWPAFRSGFDRLWELITDLAAGRRTGTAPKTITLLGGDVHHAYLAEVALPRAAGAQSVVHQAVCSPFRNPLDRRERAVVRFGASRAAHVIARALAKTTGIPDPALRWRLCQTPTFDNQFATIEIDGEHALLRIERTVPGTSHDPRIATSLERYLA